MSDVSKDVPKTPKPKGKAKRVSKAPAAAASVPFTVVKRPPKIIRPALEYQNLLDCGLPEDLALPLYKAVTTMRGGESVAEGNFVAWLVNHCLKSAQLRMIDAAGNIHLMVYTPTGKEPTSIFVAHTDTVHFSGGINNVGYEDGYIHGVDEPLGADDGAGIAILCFMMHHKVPGRYIFTRQEESGGIGSKFIKENLAGVLRKYSRAIAFDRKGIAEVIIEQGGSVCASVEFGEALSDALNDNGLLYTTSDRGVYTDTKEFRKFVPECVNISAGYYQEHGSSEHQDLTHLVQLALAAVRIDWEALPTKRDPAAQDEYDLDWDLGTYQGKYGSLYTSRYPAVTPTVTPKKEDDRFEQLKKQRVSLLEEALFDWYWGRKAPLKDLLCNTLARTSGMKAEDVRAFIKMEKLKEKDVDSMSLSDEDVAIDAMIAIVTA